MACPPLTALISLSAAAFENKYFLLPNQGDQQEKTCHPSGSPNRGQRLDFPNVLENHILAWMCRQRFNVSTAAVILYGW